MDLEPEEKADYWSDHEEIRLGIRGMEKLLMAFSERIYEAIKEVT